MTTFSKHRPLAYICSPYHAENPEELARNIARANAAVQYAIECGYAPIAPHLYIPPVLGDEGEDRETGLECSCSLTCDCDVVMVCTPHRTPGMFLEVSTAVRNGVPLIDAWEEPRYQALLEKWGVVIPDSWEKLEEDAGKSCNQRKEAFNVEYDCFGSCGKCHELIAAAIVARAKKLAGVTE